MDGARPETRRFAYIDALRGYAVLLVIGTHAINHVPNLPTPVAAVAGYGWHGVQLFFVVSALTLLLSWHAHPRPGGRRLYEFAMRRVFRIVPMYYVAAALYLVLRPPAGDVPAVHALAQLALVHGWSPFDMAVVPGSWNMVPGSWSVAVECSFYALFPLLAAVVTTLPRALLFIVAALLASVALNAVAANEFRPLYGSPATDQFLYYWLPNQLAVFGLGFVAFHWLRRRETGATPARRSGPAAETLVLALGLAYAGFALLDVYRGPLARTAGLDWPFVPRHVLVALLFAAAVVALARAPRRFVVNPVTELFGKVSYSAYLLHFAVLDGTAWLLEPVLDLKAEGLAAVPVFAALSAAAAALTLAASSVTYAAVERPMIRLGRRLGALGAAAGVRVPARL